MAFNKRQVKMAGYEAGLEVIKDFIDQEDHRGMMEDVATLALETDIASETLNNLDDPADDEDATMTFGDGVLAAVNDVRSFIMRTIRGIHKR